MKRCFGRVIDLACDGVGSLWTIKAFEVLLTQVFIVQRQPSGERLTNRRRDANAARSSQLLQALRKTPYHPYHQLQMFNSAPTSLYATGSGGG